jgi:zinc/manganese transport system substrate-binding protein
MKRIALLAAAASTLVLAGCASAPSAADGTINIVASTNVYGDIAQTIGGDLVTVTSLIDGAGQDPHSFEASAQDQLAISKADIVIENGGGYDDFVDTLLEASGSTPEVIDVYANYTAITDATGPLNEHLWYSFAATTYFAQALAERLAEIDPTNAGIYSTNADDFAGQLDGLAATAAALGSGQSVAVTEPVPVYLLEAAGLVNVTPEAFTEAIEEGGDVPPLALQETLDLFAEGSVVLLAYNDQTASPETERVRAAAEDAGVPVLNFTETLPDGQDYVSWMTANLDEIAAALS